MRKSLKKLFVPEMHRLGYTGQSSTFRRVSDEWLDVVELQYWKYGGEFIIEGGRRLRGDLHTSWGELVPEMKITIGHFKLGERARLEQREPPPNTLFRGYHFGTFGEDIARYDSLTASLVRDLPQMEAWLLDRNVGPSMTIIG